MDSSPHQSLAGKLQDLVLVGDGEPMLRLEKRMRCAATGLGVTLRFAVRQDYASFGLGHIDTPAVLLGGKVIFAGLPRTEMLEEWLRNLIEMQLEAHGEDSVAHPQVKSCGSIKS